MKKTKIQFTNCYRCGERHIDDPIYEHVCAGQGRGLVEFMEEATKPNNMPFTTARVGNSDRPLTHEDLIRMYNSCGGSMSTMRRAEEEYFLRRNRTLDGRPMTASPISGREMAERAYRSTGEAEILRREEMLRREAMINQLQRPIMPLFEKLANNA